MKQKQTFKAIFAGTAIVLMALPFLAALNSFFTQGLNRVGWYKPIQRFIVPWQTRMVAVVIKPFGVESRIIDNPVYATFYMVKNGAAIPVDLSWNCLGWQSGLLFLVSLLIGIKGNYTNISRIKCTIFGVGGTLLVNILRMSLIALGIYYVNSLMAQIVHDYLAAFFTLVWLMFFWWFSYGFILEEKNKKFD